VRIDVLTLFPEMFYGVLCSSILGKAVEKGLLTVNLVNIRDFSKDKHRRVDDYPYGRGAGMVMMVHPLYDAILSIKGTDPGAKTIMTSPRGKRFNQAIAKELSTEKHLVLVCGHYEGVDQRVIDSMVDEEISIGEYVLTGGEIPSMAIIDAVTRLLPEALGSSDSLEEESFKQGLLEYPQYTRPAEFNGMKVPEVLLSGNHKEIEKWRREKSLEVTRRFRPDLLEGTRLSVDEERRMQSKNSL